MILKTFVLKTCVLSGRVGTRGSWGEFVSWEALRVGGCTAEACIRERERAREGESEWEIARAREREQERESASERAR